MPPWSPLLSGPPAWLSQQLAGVQVTQPQSDSSRCPPGGGWVAQRDGGGGKGLRTEAPAFQPAAHRCARRQLAPRCPAELRTPRAQAGLLRKPGQLRRRRSVFAAPCPRLASSPHLSPCIPHPGTAVRRGLCCSLFPREGAKTGIEGHAFGGHRLCVGLRQHPRPSHPPWGVGVTHEDQAPH